MKHFNQEFKMMMVGLAASIVIALFINQLPQLMSLQSFWVMIITTVVLAICLLGVQLYQNVIRISSKK